MTMAGITTKRRGAPSRQFVAVTVRGMRKLGAWKRPFTQQGEEGELTNKGHTLAYQMLTLFFYTDSVLEAPQSTGEWTYRRYHEAPSEPRMIQMRIPSKILATDLVSGPPLTRGAKTRTDSRA